MFPLGEIPGEEFKSFISDGLVAFAENPENLTEGILAVTGGHPYYTQQLSFSRHLPMSAAFCLENQIESPSTVYSGLLRLSRQGYLIKVDDRYRIDDPIFERWIVKRRIV